MTRGYEGASLADVAAKAGLARTAIYNYFPDKDSLLFAWTDREVRRTLAILDQEIAEAPTHAEKLRAFIRLQLVDFASRHLPPGHEVIQFLQPETYHRFMSHIEPVERVLRSIIEEGMRSGEFVDADPESMVPMVMACIGSERAPLASRAHTVEDATDRVAAFVLRALTPPGAKPPAKRAAAKKAAPKSRAKSRR